VIVQREIYFGAGCSKADQESKDLFPGEGIIEEVRIA
jgi:hypothetical protein